MRDKSQCKKCIYRGGGTNTSYALFCDYSGKTETTCLTLKKGKVVDRRENDKNSCKLFNDGKKRKNPLKKKWR